jgi:hypothetical protein
MWILNNNNISYNNNQILITVGTTAEALREAEKPKRTNSTQKRSTTKRNTTSTISGT